MRVLWICNQCVPQIADKLHIPSSNKEGWLAGLFEVLQSRQDRFELGIAFPHTQNADFEGTKPRAFGFAEDTAHPENYEEAVTQRMKEIIEVFEPDVVHIFGTEYGHSLSAAKALNCPEKLLIGFQGVCTALADAYLNGVDEEWIRRKTLRDCLKDDNLQRQKEKFQLRAEHEKQAVSLAGYVTGRTALDRKYTQLLNPNAEYMLMNETMRSSFYEGEWEAKKALKHSIFVSQCDYPIKGFHVLIKALPKIRKDFPDVTVRVAGNTITGVGGIKKRILISTYGKYLKHLMKANDAEGIVEFLGSCTALEMKKEYLSCNVFVLPSVMENSPNCLGEAMLLGTPCVGSNVGGVSDILNPERDGILYEDNDPEKLAEAVKEMFRMADAEDEKLKRFCRQSREDAAKRHDGSVNANRLLEIYETIMQRQEQS